MFRIYSVGQGKLPTILYITVLARIYVNILHFKLRCPTETQSPFKDEAQENTYNLQFEPFKEHAMIHENHIVILRNRSHKRWKNKELWCK